MSASRPGSSTRVIVRTISAVPRGHPPISQDSFSSIEWSPTRASQDSFSSFEGSPIGAIVRTLSGVLRGHPPFP
ncbi:hypothetical protein CHS0354_038261 [Potamilus streckersoni]|uniref:Uncharacterized protein n=1 Tax=Potamilus streckersoni TaxID=2493646 RepID=A0AAE0TCI1_9BIVA|nr:hypothetical protein CHS0354_038261 [Potamilus streckersoni]